MLKRMGRIKMPVKKIESDSELEIAIKNLVSAISIFVARKMQEEKIPSHNFFINILSTSLSVISELSQHISQTSALIYEEVTKKDNINDSNTTPKE